MTDTRNDGGPAACTHCQNGWFDPKSGGHYFGQDVECVNGILIDIDAYTEGYQPDVCYPVAPCHPSWAKQQREEDFEDDSQLRLAARSSKEA